MRSLFAPLLLATSLAGCASVGRDLPDRGLGAVNVPMLARTDYVFDASAPGGMLAPGEAERLDAWFRGLGLGYGDSVHVDGGFGGGANPEVARIVGTYGMLVRPGAPVTAGAVGPDRVRVIVSRTRAEVANCPNWDRTSQPNWENRTMPNYGCAVNSNLAAMVANPEDLIHGQPASSVGDGFDAAKAIRMYRDWPLTAITEGQQKRPLKNADTKKDE